MTPQEAIEQYKQVHGTQPNYGRSGGWMAARLQQYVDPSITSILDYGYGNSDLLDRVGRGVPLKVKYDPAIPRHSKKPVGKFDLIFCTDVLEHIPEEGLEKILLDIKSLSCTGMVVFTIATTPAAQILPNGENAHCTIKSREWWREILEKYFDMVMIEESGQSFNFLARTF